MFEVGINEVTKALQSWPAANAFFIIVITFMSIMAWRRGEKDRKSNTIEYPIYMVSGPVHDAMGAIHELLSETRITNEKINRVIEIATDNSNALRESSVAVAAAMRTQAQILEDMRNLLEMRLEMRGGKR